MGSMGRSESGLKKGPWTPEEDEKLINHIQKHGHGSWRALPKLSGLNRCGKSCRLRWTNYLRPDIKRGKFSQDEEQTILNLHAILGNKWSAIATHLPGRTDNEIKNFWNTHLKKRLIQMGFDPMTHRPRTDILSSLPGLLALKDLIENPEQAIRIQNEATRLNNYLSYILQPPLPSLGADLTSLAFPPPPPQENFFQDSVSFGHMPDLVMAGCGTGQNCSSDGSWITNTGDASSYGGAQMWSELQLDDPFFPIVPPN